MSIASTLYAFEIVPGLDDTLGFAETLDRALKQARDHLEEIERVREDDDVPLGEIAIYEIILRDPTPQELIEVLEERITLLEALRVSKRRVSVVIGQSDGL